MKKFIINFSRILISLGLLLYFIYLADLKKILNTLGSLDTTPVFIAVLFFLGLTLFMSLRWRLLTTSLGIRVDFSKLVSFYMIGFFFNNFLPTSIGGDLSRAFYLGKQSGSRSTSLGTILLERMIGLLATLSLAGVSLIWLLGEFNSRRILYFTLLLVAGIALVLAMVMSRRVYRRISQILTSITFAGIGLKLSKVLDTLHYYRDKKKVLLGAYLFSLLGHVMIICMNYVLARAIGIDQVSFTYFFLLVPVTFIFSLMPSINGIGVRDSGYILLLGSQQVDTAHALSLSFLVTIVPMLISLLGGVLFVYYRHRGLVAPVTLEENSL